MRILFIHEVNYLTKPIYEMHEFPEHLAARGHEVAFWHFPEGMTKHQVSELGWKKVIPGRVMSESRITLYTPQGMSGSILGRLLTAVRASSLASKIFRDFNPDLVVSFSVPTSGWQSLKIAKKLGVPFVFRALDVSHKIRKDIFSWGILLAERFIYANADLLSANNQAMLAYCTRVAPAIKKGFVHYPPLDLSAFRSGSRAEGRQKLALKPDRRVILYLGSFFYFSGLPAVLREFKKASTDEYLVLVGGGEQEAELRRLAKSLDIESRVVFTGFIPFRELPDLIAAADVCINPMVKTLVSDAALPNKVLQYLAANVPTVSTALDGLCATFANCSGIFWESTPEGVVTKALEIARYNDPFDFEEIDGILRSIEMTAVDRFEAALKRAAVTK